MDKICLRRRVGLSWWLAALTLLLVACDRAPHSATPPSTQESTSVEPRPVDLRLMT